MKRRKRYVYLSVTLTILLLAIVGAILFKVSLSSRGILYDKVTILSVYEPSSTTDYIRIRSSITSTPFLDDRHLPEEILRILIIGNSIAIHEPSPEVGWYDYWGMAASTESKDFSHILFNYFSSSTSQPIEMRIQSVVNFERNFTEYNFESIREYQDFDADLIILRIGDNVPFERTLNEDFDTYFGMLINFLDQSGNAYVVATSSWYQNYLVDEEMKFACLKEDCHYVDISKLILDPSNQAASERTFSNPAVGSHPGDKGMEGIADLIWLEVEQWLKSTW